MVLSAKLLIKNKKPGRITGFQINLIIILR